MPAQAEGFEQFWHHYLRYHSRPGTRALHMLATAIGLIAIVAALITVDPVIAFAGIALGYAIAWTSHFLVEGNRPAMVEHPAWAFLCDIRMFRLWLTGRLQGELMRAGVTSPS